MSVTTLLTSYADITFFPNVGELLKILAVLPLGSTEVEHSLSCLTLNRQGGGGGGAESAHRLVLPSAVLKRQAVGSSNFVIFTIY